MFGIEPVNLDADTEERSESATVPVKLPAGILVKLAALPLKVVALKVPVTVAPVLCICNLWVPSE